MNHKKIQRLRREEGLRVPQKRRRKRLGTSTTPNLPVADTRTRSGPSTSSSTPRLTAARSRSHRSSTNTPANASADSSNAPPPATTSSTNSTASRPCVATRPCCAATTAPSSRASRWPTRPANESACTFIPPGEPWRDGYVESFNSRIRDECLNINIFWSLAQARVVITDWKEDYHHRRRHSSLGYQTPVAFAARANDRGLSGHSDIPPGGPRSQAVSSHARLRT